MTRSIAELVPHAGRMVLLDDIIEHDGDHILCRARTGPPGEHPLASDGQLPAEILAEYGAQAIAVHGGLLNNLETAPRPGRLVALGRFLLYCSSLKRDCRLAVRAQRLAGDSNGQVYDFEVSDVENGLLAQGRATIMFADRENRP